MNEYVGSRVDRSFLYLMAIYVIHGILLHVFLRPINATGINIDKTFIQPSVSSDWSRFLHDKNESSVDIEINENYQVVRNSKNRNKQVMNEPLLQKTPGDESSYILVTSESSSAAICAFIIAVINNISPAAWGIISGCIVFSLTFTENDNIR